LLRRFRCTPGAGIFALRVKPPVELAAVVTP
jgi:hypothetical protein